MKLLLYDGTCNLCHWAVQWVKRRAIIQNFQFESLESEFGQQILAKYPHLKQVDSIIFLDESGIYIQSKAMFRISRYLRFPWPMIQIFKLLPTFFTDALYQFVARNRKKWFGEKTYCEL